MLDQTSIFDFVEDNHYSYDKVLAHKRPIKLFEAFAGIGCQRMALNRLNIPYESVGISEIDKYALLSYEAIHGDCRNYGDITKMTYIPDCDIFTWSFPCTDLSKAGKQKGLIKGGKIQEIDKTVFSKEYSYKFFDEMTNGLSQEELYGNIAFYQNEENPFIIEHDVNIDFGISVTEQIELPKEMKKEVIKILQNRLLKLEGKEGTRSGLVYEVLRLLRVTENKPKVLIMENVVDLVQVKFAPQFYEIQKELEKLGYQNYTQVLNGKDYGVAQNRERVFMVSILGGGRYEFPLREVLTKRLKDYLEPVVDEKYYLSDRQIGLIHASTFRTTQSRIQDDDVGVVVNTTSLKTKMCNELIMSGKVQNYDVIRHSYTNSRMKGEMKDIQENNISPTLDTRADCLGVVQDLRIRKLTPKECWRLMGISDEDFYKVQAVVSNSQLYKIAGNGIIIDVFEKILKGLI